MTSWFMGNEGKDMGKDYDKYGVGDEGKDRGRTEARRERTEGMGRTEA